MLSPDTHQDISLQNVYYDTIEQVNNYNDSSEDLKIRYARYLINLKYPNKYKRRQQFCDDTDISIATYNRFREGRGVNHISLLKICIGINLSYEESIICFTIHGIFLLTDNYYEQSILYALYLLKNEGFRNLSIYEKVDKVKEVCPSIDTMYGYN